MRHQLIAAAVAAGAAAIAAPAQACAVHERLNLGSIRSADLVVVGYVIGRRTDRGNDTIFAVAVDEVLRGRAGRTLAMRFEFPGTALPGAGLGGRFLIALRSPGAGATPPRAFTILQHICSDPFILEAGSPRAGAARRLLPQRQH